MQQAKQEHRHTGKPARVFWEFGYRTKKSWSRARRVIAKAEQIEGKGNPRYLVTSLSAQDWSAQKHYEQPYCARGEMENRIKEQLSLVADRLSTRRRCAPISFAAVFFFVGLRAGGGLAAVGLGGHGVGGSTGRHHPAEAAENRRAGAHQRTPHLGTLQSRLSLAEGLHRVLDSPALLKRKNKISSRTSIDSRGLPEKHFPPGTATTGSLEMQAKTSSAEKTHQHKV